MIEVIQTPCYRCGKPVSFIDNCDISCEQAVQGIRIDYYNQDGDSLGSACPDTSFEGALPLCGECMSSLIIWLNSEEVE